MIACRHAERLLACQRYGSEHDSIGDEDKDEDYGDAVVGRPSSKDEERFVSNPLEFLSHSNKLATRRTEHFEQETAR